MTWSFSNLQLLSGIHHLFFPLLSRINSFSNNLLGATAVVRWFILGLSDLTENIIGRNSHEYSDQIQIWAAF